MKVVFKGQVGSIAPAPNGGVLLSVVTDGSMDKSTTPPEARAYIEGEIRITLPRNEDGSDPVATSQAITVTIDIGGE